LVLVCPNGQIGLQFSGGEGGMRRLSNNKELNKNKKRSYLYNSLLSNKKALVAGSTINLSIHPSLSWLPLYLL
jgi:hypothetical protein